MCYSSVDVSYLANGRISSQHIGILHDRKLAGHSLANLQDTSPFCKSGSSLVVFLASLRESIQSLSGSFLVCTAKFHSAFVNLNTNNNTILLQDLREWFAILCLLEKCLLEEDDTPKILGKLFGVGGEQKFTVCASVWLNVFDLNLVETFSDRARRFISGKDTFAGSHDGLGGFGKFLTEFLRCGVHDVYERRIECNWRRGREA